jgi:hypothetical protein
MKPSLISTMKTSLALLAALLHASVFTGPTSQE